MSIIHARTQDYAVDIIRYDGTNGTDISALVGESNVNHGGTSFQVLNGDGDWIDVHPGWYAGIIGEGKHMGQRVVLSPGAYQCFLSPE